MPLSLKNTVKLIETVWKMALTLAADTMYVFKAKGVDGASAMIILANETAEQMFIWNAIAINGTAVVE